MKVAPGTDLTTIFTAGQKAFRDWIGLREVWIVKVTPKIVKIVDVERWGHWTEDGHKKVELTFEQACQERAWSLDMDKVNKELFQSVEQFKAWKANQLNDQIGALLVRIAKLTTERDELLADLKGETEA